jgi:hypothetical protein
MYLLVLEAPSSTLFVSCQLLRRQMKQVLTLEFRLYSEGTNFYKCHYETKRVIGALAFREGDYVQRPPPPGKAKIR